MFWLIIPAAVVVFLAVLVIRALQFNPPAQTAEKPEEVTFDKEAAVHALAELVRCRTVSYYDHSLEDDAEFEKLIALLPDLYPNVMKTCSFTRMEDRALLFKWKGSSDGDPAVLMAHYDVVPVNEELWEKPWDRGLKSHGGAGGFLRLHRAERRREIHHDTNASRADQTDGGKCEGPRV